MICWAKTVAGKRLLLQNMASAVLCRDDDAPADSFTGVFGGEICDVLKAVELYRDGRCVFSGIVDEQNRFYTPQGCTTQLVCRSKEAILLDNAVQPQVLRNPSLQVLFCTLLKPLGFTALHGPDTVLQGSLTLQKNESIYSVLAGLCSKISAADVYIDPQTGSVECGTGDASAQLWLQNLTRVDYLLDNTARISEVRLQNTLTGSFDSVYPNPAAGAGGVLRVRYASCLDGAKLASAVQNGEKKAYMECGSLNSFTAGTVRRRCKKTPWSAPGRRYG